MNVFQAAKQVDCGELMDRLRIAGRFTANGRGKWLCPFHDDHDPSMVTYPSEPGRPAHFYCFTCQQHGDAVDLYSRIRKTAPLDAARELCKQFGLIYDDAAPREKPMTNDDPQLAVVLAIVGEWQRYRIAWYKEQLQQAQERLQQPRGYAWAEEMERMWVGHYQEQLKRYERMTEWEVLQDIRKEFEALGVNPYRRLHVAGTVT